MIFILLTIECSINYLNEKQKTKEIGKNVPE